APLVMFSHATAIPVIPSLDTHALSYLSTTTLHGRQPSKYIKVGAETALAGNSGEDTEGVMRSGRF
ncbi:uncharacterized protein METZ01_LOCUS253708, partial [marine metagenome]